MSGPVGTGSFWTGIVDYVSGADLDEVLQTIDESWPIEQLLVDSTGPKLIGLGSAPFSFI